VRTWTTAGCVLLALAATLPVHTASSPVPADPAFLFTAAPQYNPMVWLRGGERFPLGASVFIKEGNKQRSLIPSFAASADSDVSFDGKRVLFSGKREAKDRWQVWEVAVTGGQPRQVTKCPNDCLRPFYLPEDRVVYARNVRGHFIIEVAPLAGGAAIQLTYGPANFLPTDVLRDGRVLFEASNPLGNKTSSELYTVYSDGSGFESYRCDHGPYRHSGKQVSSGDIVFAHQRGLARFTSALAQEVHISAPNGEYAGDLVETAAGEWILPWRSKADQGFELKLWKPGMSVLRPLLAKQGFNVVQPALLAERPIPNRHPTALHDWPYGNLLCLNAYVSKYEFTDGSIASVRLSTIDASGRPRILGTAPVERDGSFYLKVPGDQPLQFEVLDNLGRTLRKETGWFWMRRGEQRVCAGCHAGPERSPEDAVPAVLLRSATPADLTGTLKTSASGGH